jgi:hypothetical protein
MMTLFKKQDKVSAEVVNDISLIKGIKTVAAPMSQSGSYVNLQRIVKDHSPLVMEYLDNEISNLKQKIQKLEEERLLVSKLYQVIQDQKTSSQTFL